jgi:hypothetical protein
MAYAGFDSKKTEIEHQCSNGTKKFRSTVGCGVIVNNYDEFKKKSILKF